MADAPHDSEIVLAALESGEWVLQRHLPQSCFTDAGNKNHAWSVKRAEAPYSSEDGNHVWTGPTAIAALQKACAALDLALPAAPPSPPVAAPAERSKHERTKAVLEQVRRLEAGHNRNPFRPLLERLMTTSGSGYSITEILQMKNALDGFYGAPRPGTAPLSDEQIYARRETYGEILCRITKEAETGIACDVVEADALEFRREQYGLTAADFAAVLGMQQSHYSEVVNQRRRLPINAVARAVAIGVPASPLLAGRGIGHPTTPTPKD